MSADGASWLDREERVREERPDLALAALALKPGMTIADVGAGTGFYALRFAKLVEPGGHVFATDLQRRMIELLQENVNKQQLRNVTVVQGSESDCKLPPSSVDVVFLADVYHEFSQPQAMIRSLRRALKPDGQLVLLEFRADDPKVPIRPEHEMTVHTARIEIEPEGFVFKRAIETMPWQHIILFTKPATSPAHAGVVTK